MSDPAGPAACASGPEHDAWLREALRHAPDASASPPPALRDAILAEARAATHTAAPPRAASASLLDQALAFWSWLARPPVAAGFASVMAATLVGMLWWDRPMDETMPPPSSPPVAMAPRAVPERTPATMGRQGSDADADKPASLAADRLREAAKTPAAAELREATPTTAPSTTPATAPAPAKTASPRADAKRGAVEGPKAERKDDRRERTSPSSTATAQGAGAPAAPAPGAVRSMAEAPAPFPLPGPTAPPPSPAQGRAEPFALAKKAEQGEKEDASDKARAAPTSPAPRLPAPSGALDAALESRQSSRAGGTAAQNAAEPATRRPVAPVASATQPMAPLLAALTSEDSRWTRRLASGESVAVDASARHWLAQVQAAASRWEPSTGRSAPRDGPAAAAFPASTLRLDRDGRSGAIVQIEDGGVRFEPLSGGAWFAALPPEVLARLRATLPPASR